METWRSSEYLGEKSDVRPYLALCHVYVLPSYHEGLSRSTLVAMSIGRPVITTDAVGCRETFEEGINGFKVPVGDIESLASIMQWCINNRDYVGLLTEQCRKIVQERLIYEGFFKARIN